MTETGLHNANSIISGLIPDEPDINVLNYIWFIRNQTRFQDKKFLLKSAINSIIDEVSLTSNKTNLTSVVDITEFVLLKDLKVNIHLLKAPLIKEVIWNPPIQNWINVNIDGALTKNPLRASFVCVWCSEIITVYFWVLLLKT